MLIKDAFKLLEQKRQLEALQQEMEDSKLQAVQRAVESRGQRRKAPDPLLQLVESENRDLQLRPAKKLFKLKKKKKGGKITDFFNTKPRKN